MCLFFAGSFFFFSRSAKNERPKGEILPNCSILDSLVFDNFTLADE